MGMAKVGYARVSMTGQGLANQIEQLTGLGCATIFREQASGTKSDRPQLAKLLASLEAGDTVVVTRLIGWLAPHSTFSPSSMQ